MRFLLGLISLAGLCAAQQATAGKAQNERSAAPVSLEQLSFSLEKLTNTVRPAVVQVFTTGLAPVSEEAEGTTTSLFTKQRATGSGVILSADGYILTNAHVIREAVASRCGLD